MTIEDLNKALYDKMNAEIEQYKGWLLTQSAEEILAHTTEFTMKQDILLSMEFHELDYAQAQALLESPTPLEDVYGYYNNTDCGYLDTIWDSIQGRADDVLAAQKALPVYNHSSTYAREHGELEEYRVSLKTNLACRDAIDDAISRHYQDNSLSGDAVTEVLDAFGFERTMYVLANTIQRKDWDQRFSCVNRKWAQTVDVCENPDGFGGDRRLGFVLNSHSGLVNLFTDEARHRLLQIDRKPRSSVRAKLHNAQPVASTPRPAAKNKGMEL